MTKLIFSDLDETLLVKHHVPEVNRIAVAKAISKGNKFIPCTGRAFFMIGDILDETNLTGKDHEYSILYNGALIMENNGNVLYQHGLSYEDTLGPFEVAKKENICAMIFTKDACHLFNPDPTELERKKAQGTEVVKHYEYDMSCLKDEFIAKILLIKANGMEYLKDLYNTFTKEFIDQYEITFSSGRYMEFNAVGVSKGYGVKFLADYLGLSIEDTIAIGDNYNDVEMIKAAGLGCCVASSNDDIKAISDYVCVRDYPEGSVAEVIEKFVL